jgi:Pectate lyase superfamily protein
MAYIGASLMPDFDVKYPATPHGWGALNPKSFGAVADGITDDTVALQACFDAAFGPKENPNGFANRHKNRSVYFPPGGYTAQKPLYITGAQGGKIFGDGARNTYLGLSPATEDFGSGTFWRSSETAPKLTPLFCLNRCAHLVFENIGFGHGYAPNYPAGSCIFDICNIGAAGGAEAKSTMFQLVTSSVGGGQYGIVVGYQDSGIGNDNGTIYDTNISDALVAGLRLMSPSAVNWSVFGGGIAGNCIVTEGGWLRSSSTFVPGGDGGNYGAGYSCVQGQISYICAISNSQNGWDFINAGGNAMSIQSGSCETALVMAATNNSVISVDALVARNTHPEAQFFDAQLGGMIHSRSCVYSPSATTSGYIANVGSTGRYIGDNLEKGAADFDYNGSPGGVMWIRSARPWTSQNDFLGFTGQMAQFRPEPDGTRDVLSATPAAPKFRGLMRVISDSVSSTPGSTVVGGGTNKVFAYCTGSVWRIIGPAG